MEDKQIIFANWTPETSDMSIEFYKETLLEYQKICLENKIRKTIWDSQKMNFTITLELQEWTNEVFKPFFNIGKVAMAIIMSKDFITQLSIEQVMSEEVSNQINQRFFEDYESAEGWILKF